MTATKIPATPVANTGAANPIANVNKAPPAIPNTAPNRLVATDFARSSGLSDGSGPAKPIVNAVIKMPIFPGILGIFSNNFGASLRISSISPTFFIIDVKSEPIFFPAFTTLSKNFSSRIIGSVEHLNE